MYFNPRAPRGARPWTTGPIAPEAQISIHALREERDGRLVAGLVLVRRISIHALREERDYRSPPACCRCGYFNPRAPRGARHHRKDGCDSDNQISIHALREESDTTCCAGGFTIWYFNPRAPRGARPGAQSRCGTPSPFQSTRSARSATQQAYIQAATKAISIHALREERDGGIAATD